MKKVVCLYGSPRPGGNSAVMADAVCEGAQLAGAEVQRLSLAGPDMRGCQGCLACKKKKEVCVLQDGLTPVLEAVRGCDVLVLATPVYFGEVSAQAKAFIDRTYSFLTPDYALNREHRTRLEKGKSLCMVIAQGHPRADLFTDIFPRYAYFFNWLGFTHARLLRECKVYHLGDAKARAGLLERAAELGRQLVRGEGEPDFRPPVRGS